MIEIISIIITFLSLLLFFNFPFNFFLIRNNFTRIQLSYNESLLINIVFNCNLLLLLSFFPINLNFIFILFIIGSFIFTVMFYKNFIHLIKKKFYSNSLFFLIFYSMSILLIKNGYLEWDGLAHWFLKAKVYYQGGGYENLAGLPFDYYPHLGPYIWALFWKNSLIQIEYSGRLFYIFIFLISIFTLRNKLNKKYSELEKNILTFVLILLSTNFFLFGGYQEYFLFFIFFSFSHFFIKYFINQKNNFCYFQEILMLLITNCILWIKQEGFFYFIILNFIFLIHSKINLKKKVIYLCITIFMICFFYLIKYHFFGTVRFNESVINSETFKNFDIVYLLSKILIIIKYFIISFLKYPIWILILLSIFLLRFDGSFFKLNKFVYTYVFLTFGFIFAIFLNTPDDIAWLAPLTLNRILFATSGFLVFLNIELFNKIRK